ncbi:hypothetical protein PSTG_06998 [Puccinia striiformis f. sp. tritici PST-78]|uniref:Chromatin modification-related protein n=1 Tax=Puccinia striiformis f. sp. tritici PST-78 TaxID=1165861 RepID=A0A0L0VKA2_9BASI|nr:hypothetical protein PSTG_06998 [Puccinia striiformis f. sp. tritici PST-78]
MAPKSTTATATAAVDKNKKNKKKKNANRILAIQRFAESVHLVQGFADTLDAIPPSLTRSISDLKELDAVLDSPLNQLNQSLNQLIQSLKQPQSIQPKQRLELIRTLVSDIQRYKLGAQDKIRVANGTCESLSHHIRQLDTTTSLLISSLPPSLESQLPPSTFPTGYPKLSGSLRSKPIGGVWQNSNPSNLQQPSPPSIPTREFINFHHHHHHHDSPLRHPQPPLPKRPRLNDPDLLEPSGSKPSLDQHIYSQSIHDKNRTIHHGNTRTLAPQHSQSPNLTSTTTATAKTKRARIPSALVDTNPDNEDWSKPPVTVPGTKKRVRKSNPTGSVGKNHLGEDQSTKIPESLKPNGIGSTQYTTSPSIQPNSKLTTTTTTTTTTNNNSSTVGGSSTTARKTATGVRQTTVTKPDGTIVTTGPPAKRAYTKRSTLTNPAGTTGAAKGKRANTKKVPPSEVGTSNEPIIPKDPLLSRKSDPAKKSHISSAKSVVRLEDVLEAGQTTGTTIKARQRKTTNNSNSIGNSEISKRDGDLDPDSLSRHPLPLPPPIDHHPHPTQSGEHPINHNRTKSNSSSKKRHEDSNNHDTNNKREEEVENRSDFNHSSPSIGSGSSSSTKAYCFCKGQVYGDRMVACDNSECPIEWFHYQCAGLTEDPTGNWFCPDCKSLGFGSTINHDDRRDIMHSNHHQNLVNSSSASFGTLPHLQSSSSGHPSHL